MAPQTPSACETRTFPLAMLPDELQNRVLFHLPTDDALRYKSVCKEWQLAVEAWASSLPMGYTPQPQKPLYFIYNSKGTNLGAYAYNSDKGKWVPSDHILNYAQKQMFPRDLQLFNETSFKITASRGLVCLIDAKTEENILVCNPVLKNKIKLLPKVPSVLSDYCAIALSTNVRLRKYIVALIRSEDIDGPFTQKVSIQLYNSETRSWVNLHNESANGWQVSGSSVICRDVLYSAVQFPYWYGTLPCNAIVAYDLSQGKQHQSLARTMVRVPWRFTHMRLLNLSDKVIMVGCVHKQGMMEGIGIWEMWGTEWREISRAPHDLIIKHFRGIFNYIFQSSGCGGLVFIQAYNSPLILTYEFSNNTWAVLPKAPLSWLTDGFCFEPRLDDIVP